MAKKKKKPGLIERIGEIEFHRFLFHPASLFVAATAVVIGISSYAWERQQDSIADAQFRLQPAMIRLNPAPNWIRNDIADSVFSRQELAQTSLLDSDATQKVWDAFAADSRVAKVVQVVKRPDAIEVTLEYRQPVGMVEVGEHHLLAVDAEGVVLDGKDFQQEAAVQYLRIAVERPMIRGMKPGGPWPDDRIVAAAKIAELIGALESPLAIHRVVSLDGPGWNLERHGSFELWTADQVRFVWGNAPGFEAAGEASAEEKLQALADQWSNLEQQMARQKIWDLRKGDVKPLTRLQNVMHPAR